MNHRTRRLLSTAALALAVIFAAAAATQAEATFMTPSQSKATETANQARPHANTNNKTAKTADCPIKPRWTQVWSTEKAKLVWKKDWVKRCGTGY